MSDNREYVKRAVESSALANGGKLDPEQQRQFLEHVKEDIGGVLSSMRFETPDRPEKKLPLLHVGEAVTESAEENTQATDTVDPKFQDIALNCKKLRVRDTTSRELLMQNVQQGDYANTMFQMIGRRHGYDLLTLYFLGDTTITGTYPDAKLLKRLDGFMKKSEAARVRDYAGARVQSGIFADMLRRLPARYKRNTQNLRWYVPASLLGDWQYLLTSRQTDLGDRMLQAANGVASIMGIQVVPVGPMPSDKEVPEAAAVATPPSIVGTRYGPFEIVTGSNDELVIDVDNAGPQTITIPAGVYMTVELANILNAAFATHSFNALATDNGDGKLRISGTTSGTSGELDVGAGSNVLTTLGLTAAVTAGKAAGTGGTVPEGSEILLTTRDNLIGAYVLTDDTNSEYGAFLTTRYDDDYDVFKTTIYNHVDCAIENLDAVVKGVGIRQPEIAIV